MVELEAEKAARLRAEEKIIKLDVTKSEFVQNALRLAIMRGRQAKEIERAQQEQKEIQ